jgi:hypothetical protein
MLLRICRSFMLEDVEDQSLVTAVRLGPYRTDERPHLIARREICLDLD